MTAILKANWNYPTTVWHGPGRIGDLPLACKVTGIKRPLFVTDAGLKDSAIVAEAIDLLKGVQSNPSFFSDVKGNPAGANVSAGISAFAAAGCDGVVAMGGGSALDIGKCIAFMSGQSRPLWDFEDVGDNWTRADASRIASVIAIPTTAGTGSEVGRASVITDEENHEKKIIFHPLMLPKIVISDPELSSGLPPNLTAWTGMDALAHCLEAFCAPGFHPMADGIAVEGIRLIGRYLPRAVENGTDLEARSRMLAAASMGAAAFQKGLGAIHSISHPVGALYDTHHGLTNAVVMPYVLAFNRTAIDERISYLSTVLNLPQKDFSGFLEWTLEFRERNHVPHSLTALGVDEDRIGELAEKALRDPSTGGNPKPMTCDDFRHVIRAAIRGRIDEIS